MWKIILRKLNRTLLLQSTWHDLYSSQLFTEVCEIFHFIQFLLFAGSSCTQMFFFWVMDKKLRSVLICFYVLFLLHIVELLKYETEVKRKVFYTKEISCAFG